MPSPAPRRGLEHRGGCEQQPPGRSAATRPLAYGRSARSWFSARSRLPTPLRPAWIQPRGRAGPVPADQECIGSGRPNRLRRSRPRDGYRRGCPSRGVRTTPRLTQKAPVSLGGRRLGHGSATHHQAAATRAAARPGIDPPESSTRACDRLPGVRVRLHRSVGAGALRAPQQTPWAGLDFSTERHLSCIHLVGRRARATEVAAARWRPAGLGSGTGP